MEGMLIDLKMGTCDELHTRNDCSHLSPGSLSRPSRNDRPTTKMEGTDLFNDILLVK